jgi:hypothetical protein
MRIVPIVFALAALVAAPRAARACSCLPPPSPVEAAEQAVAVFEGRTFGVVREGQHNRFTFEVTRVWKGEVGTRVDVWSHSQSATCGRGFESGASYVVYAGSRDGHLVDGLCSRTREISRASEDLEALGTARTPADPAAPASATAAPEVEPPRIEPREPAVPPPQPSARGCAAGDRTVGLALLPLALALFRRSRSRTSRSQGAQP